MIVCNRSTNQSDSFELPSSVDQRHAARSPSPQPCTNITAILPITFHPEVPLLTEVLLKYPVPLFYRRADYREVGLQFIP